MRDFCRIYLFAMGRRVWAIDGNRPFSVCRDQPFSISRSFDSSYSLCKIDGSKSGIGPSGPHVSGCPYDSDLLVPCHLAAALATRQFLDLARRSFECALVLLRSLYPSFLIQVFDVEGKLAI